MQDLAEERVEIRAIKFAESYYRKMGWEVMNVSRSRGEHSGYDLFLRKDSELLKVEVKGCTRLYQIPDLYHTEIDQKSGRLIADELCVVYYLPEMQRKLAIIRREDILPEHIVPKSGYRITGKFKNARTMNRFLVEIDEN